MAFRKIAQFAPGARSPKKHDGPVIPETGDDLLDAFASEADVLAAARSGRGLPATVVRVRPRTRVPPAVTWAGVIAATVATTVGGMWLFQQRAVQPATLRLETTPPGAQVAIGGKPSGVTPLALSLPAGDYPVVLSTPAGQRRELAVSLTAGSTTVQHIEMPAAAPASASATGALYVESNPAGQAVLVDGVQRGRSPLTIESLSSGEHVVLVRGDRGTTSRTVNVRAGQTVSLVFAPVAPATPGAGWVTFSSPVPLQLSEDGKIVGTTQADRLMLPAGNHELELTNESLGFRTTRRVAVTADRTTSVRVEVPNGRVSINALPWAEVFVGGERLGETPLANISLPIGSHQIELRHPQFGVRRATATVSVGQTARVGVDMRTPGN